MCFLLYFIVLVFFNMMLGGGCEFSLYVDCVVVSVEMYMGFVEVGVGLIFGGGGIKEMLLCFIDF